MAYPVLNIDLDKIEHNTRVIVALCAEKGVSVSGVTKGVCGNPHVANAMLRGGVAGIADSRLDNIRRMREAGVQSSYMLLRLPALSKVDEVIDCVDISLNAELATLQALSASALRRGKVHDVILMLDMGDLREGVWPDQIIELAGTLNKLKGIRLAGVGTNLACFSGVMPSQKNMQYLVDLAGEIERICSLRLQWISGLNSSGLNLLAGDGLPERINHARIGEAILLGRETTQRKPWPETYQDAFVLQAEIIELQKKPWVFNGEHGQDAFGGRPGFENRGEILQALVNIGRQDIDIGGVTPCQSLSVLGASSGYLVLDASILTDTIRLGDVLSFNLNYSALLAAMTSAYVEKQCIQGSLIGDSITHATN